MPTLKQILEYKFNMLEQPMLESGTITNYNFNRLMALYRVLESV